MTDNALANAQPMAAEEMAERMERLERANERLLLENERLSQEMKKMRHKLYGMNERMVTRSYNAIIASSLRKKLYLCSRKAAKTGGASAIGASLIAFGLHEPCHQITLKRKEIMCKYNITLNDEVSSAMTKQFYAVFDTNVLVSALMSTRLDSPTVRPGNLRHFPKTPIVVTPADMVKMMEGNDEVNPES